MVHGRNEAVREKVARELERLDLEAIVLHEHTSRGRTVIEKFEDHALDVGYAVILLTPDDTGGVRMTQIGRSSQTVPGRT